MGEREPGPYWVKLYGGEWRVAEWLSGCWGLAFNTDRHQDSDFAEIGERAERNVFDENDEKVLEQIRQRFAQPRWPEPQPITDAQKTGEDFLVWCVDRWLIAAWWSPSFDREIAWYDDHNRWLEEAQVTHYLPLPPDVKP